MVYLRPSHYNPIKTFKKMIKIPNINTYAGITAYTYSFLISSQFISN